MKFLRALGVVMIPLVFLGHPVALAATRQSSDKKESPKGNSYSALGFTFSAEFPAKPEIREDSLTSKGGIHYKRKSFAAETNDSMVLIGFLVDIDKSLPTTGDEDSFFSSTIDSAVKAWGPKFKFDTPNGQRTYTFHDMKAKEVRGRIGTEAAVVLRVIITEHGMLMIQAIYQPTTKAKASVEHFLASFDLLSGE